MLTLQSKQSAGIFDSPKHLTPDFTYRPARSIGRKGTRIYESHAIGRSAQGLVGRGFTRQLQYMRNNCSAPALHNLPDAILQDETRWPLGYYVQLLLPFFR